MQKPKVSSQGQLCSFRSSLVSQQPTGLTSERFPGSSAPGTFLTPSYSILAAVLSGQLWSRESDLMSSD